MQGCKVSCGRRNGHCRRLLTFDLVFFIVLCFVSVTVRFQFKCSAVHAGRRLTRDWPAVYLITHDLRTQSHNLSNSHNLICVLSRQLGFMDLLLPSLTI